MSSKARSAAPLSSHDALLSQASAAALAEARLREAGVRVTDARVKVLAALLEAPSASSHQDMQELFADMDRVTLYRALDCLTEASLAHKIAGDDRVFRYSPGTEMAGEGERRGPQAQGTGHQHGHFKCTACARVFCLDGDALWPGNSQAQTPTPGMRQQLQSVVQDTLGKGFKAHDIELTIKGWCADCSR
ncbi:MAG: Fur family transcriptional regulator [Janthinobacterium lividum]